MSTALGGALGALAVAVSLTAGGGATQQDPAGNAPRAVSAEANTVTLAGGNHAACCWDVPALPPGVQP